MTPNPTPAPDREPEFPRVWRDTTDRLLIQRYATSWQLGDEDDHWRLVATRLSAALGIRTYEDGLREAAGVCTAFVEELTKDAATADCIEDAEHYRTIRMGAQWCRAAILALAGEKG